ncbi:MAG TPA: ribosome small subunit-dependent GTPase A [Actinomycetota bacterium]|nr:ribosome small subunit-dependent GTPase A [Actinomycetota bacterium]
MHLDRHQDRAATRDGNLVALGWNQSLEDNFKPHHDEGLLPARVIAQHRGSYVVVGPTGELSARSSGKLHHAASAGGVLPAVGDWVGITADAAGTSVIRTVMPRRGIFSRNVADGSTEEQVLAANIDLALVVGGLDRDFNLRRMERYLAVAYAGGAAPVIVLTKADLCDDVDDKRSAVSDIAPGVPIEVISNLTGAGIDGVREHLSKGQTAVVLGSSGVGKSSLINHLLGSDAQRTGAVRRDGKGRHVTTHRELFLLPGGALIIDTPGIRQLKLWSADEGLPATFEDVEALASQCRFSDCGHESEPGCAIKEAIATGELSTARFNSYLKLMRELRSLEVRRDARARSEEQKKWRKIHLDYRARTKFARKNR